MGGRRVLLLWVVSALLFTLVGGGVFLAVRVDRLGGQEHYTEEIDQARQQLFQGQIVYTDARTLRLVAGADPHPFRVRVLGSRRRAGPGEAQAPVNAGAQIGVKLHCSGAGVRCTPLSSERQNVLSRSDGATWVWDVTAQRAGKVSVTLTVTAYFRGSDTVLVEKPPMTTRVHVAAPPGDSGWFSWVKDLWRGMTGVLTGLGGLAVSVSAIVALVVMVVRRRPPTADLDETGTLGPVRGEDRRPRGPSVRAGPSHPGRVRTRPAAVRSRPAGRRRHTHRGPRE